MYRALIALLVVAAFLVPTHRSEAAPSVTCTGPSTTQNLGAPGAYYMLQIGSGQQWITAVCVKTADQTVSVTKTGTTDIIGGCYFVLKTQRYAIIGNNPNMSTCPPIQSVQINVAKAVASQH